MFKLYSSGSMFLMHDESQNFLELHKSPHYQIIAYVTVIKYCSISTRQTPKPVRMGRTYRSECTSGHRLPQVSGGPVWPIKKGKNNWTDLGLKFTSPVPPPFSTCNREPLLLPTTRNKWTQLNRISKLSYIMKFHNHKLWPSETTKKREWTNQLTVINSIATQRTCRTMTLPVLILNEARSPEARTISYIDCIAIWIITNWLNWCLSKVNWNYRSPLFWSIIKTILSQNINFNK